MAAGRSGRKAAEELELYRGFVDRFFDHNLSGFFGVRDSEKTAFDSAGIREYWRRLAADVRVGRKAGRVDMYVSIPFCERLCGFCNLGPEKLGARGRVAEYLDWLVGAMEFFAPRLADLRLGNLLVGGGTPSVLTLDEMERLFTALFNVTVSPVTSTRSALTVLPSALVHSRTSARHAAASATSPHSATRRRRPD